MLESIGKPLKNRKNIIITRNKNYKVEDSSVEIYNDVNEVLKRYNNQDVFVIGGKQIYLLFNNHADKLLVSRLPNSYNCDTFMNDFNYSSFYISNVQEKEEFKIYEYLRK